MALPTVQLATLLECKICMDIYHKPKQLLCRHTYCQDCLDGTLVFQEDGSAELHCPLSCSEKTTVEKNTTTSSLATAYTLVDILKQMSNVDKNNLQCQHNEECKRIVSCSCNTCGTKVCNKCQILHPCVKKSFTAVTFNKNSKELQPLCEQHNSLSSYVCTDCDNMFTCVYYVNREHKNHKHQTIAETGLETKRCLEALITSFEDTRSVLEMVSRQYNDAVESLRNDREILIFELKLKKLKRLDDYLKMLNAEEENLLREFDEKANEFKSRSIDTKIKEFSDHAHAFISKCHFELVAEKIDIEQKICSLFTSPTSFPKFNSCLHQMDEKKCLQNPLGRLEVSINNVSAGIDIF